LDSVIGVQTEISADIYFFFSYLPSFREFFEVDRGLLTTVCKLLRFRSSLCISRHTLITSHTTLNSKMCTSWSDCNHPNTAFNKWAGAPKGYIKS
jgi:hypothetical protein